MNSRFLRVTLTDSGNILKMPYSNNIKVVINANRQDGQSKGFDGEVNEDGTLTVPLHSWMLELDGLVICDISVMEITENKNKKLTTTSFELMVEKAAYGGDDVTTDPQYDVLVELIEKVENIAEGIEDPVGKKTENGGEIFNDYDHNKAAEFAFVCGNKNEGGVSCQVGGKENTILGTNSLASGNKNYIAKECETSAIFGFNNQIKNGKRHLVFGSDNTVEDTRNSSLFIGNLVGGSANAISSGNYNIIGGSNNISQCGGSNLIVGGNNKNVYGEAATFGYANIFGGNSNTIYEGMQNIIAGETNTIEKRTGKSEGYCNIVSGRNNVVNAKRSLVFGDGNVVGGLDSVLVGGKYANVATDTLMVLGNGADSNNRSNAIEIKKDGRIYINNVEISETINLNSFATQDWVAENYIHIGDRVSIVGDANSYTDNQIETLKNYIDKDIMNMVTSRLSALEEEVATLKQQVAELTA